ncbi:zinc-binding alcohol dehydrogenase [Marispirochaeta aestuarii]|uniref:zinc-dependent alcohol dehydrogenase n=1 Tax=Marispirochaeta aestuarii TaxID=1963862 RepID=UPI0029C88D43|nr:zinc-binding alcohol dehydrogenase [Marispirochaeta aestuarii]
MSAVDCRALYFTAPGKIEIREEPPPSPEEGELILQSCLQGISPGTERLMFTGNFPRGMQSDPAIDGFSGSFDYPFRYGYINVAVDDTGRRFFAFRDHVTRFTARPEELIPLPDSMNNETALLIPHTETALSIVHDLNPHLGDRVLISGAGIVGTLTAELLDRYQGCKVTVVDPLPDKVRFFDTERIAFFTSTGEVPGYGNFDAAVDASAAAAGLQSCIDGVGFEGRVVAASWFGDREVGLNLGRNFHRKRLKLISSQVSHIGPSIGSLWNKERRMQLTLQIVESMRRLDLITARFPLSRSIDAFTLITTADMSVGLIALDPEE